MMQFYRAFSSQPNLLEIVSKLRSQTALSMNLCRKAALESNLDFDIALQILSKSANAPIKSNAALGSSSFGKEGLIGVMGSATLKCLIDLRCDSDFVSRNPEFISLADTIMQSVLNSNSISADKPSKILTDDEIKEKVNYYRSKFRENIGLESYRVIEAESTKSQAIGHYIHQRFGNNTGKIGSLVKVESNTAIDTNKLEDIGHSLSRQIVALGDPEVNVTKLLNSDYLFAPIGTVRKFIEQCEENLSSKITVSDLAYVKIK